MVTDNQFLADASGVFDTSPSNAVFRDASDSHLLLGEWGRGFDTEDDNITSLNAIKHGLVWACINVIAGDLGQIPLNVVRNTEDGCEPAENHPIHYLLNVRPNPWQTPAAFIEYLDSQVEIWGNGFAEIVRDGSGRVTQLLPIPSRYMNYDVDKDGEPFYYMTQPEPGADVVVFSLDEVLHITGLTGNGFWGYRLVEIAFPELRLARSNLRHASASYANGAVPSGVLEHPGKLPPEGRAQLRASWQETHGGSRNRGKTAILWEGMKYNAVAASAHDAQLMESIQHNPRLIGMLFQLAPYKLGDWSESSTRANLEDSQKEYFQSTLSRRLNKIIQEMNYKLFPARSNKFRIKPDPTELLKGDKKTQVETAGAAVAGLLWTQNEGRNYLGMNKVEGGDEFINPNTTANAGQDMEPDEEETEEPEDTQDIANRMRALVLAQSGVVVDIEKNKVSGKARTKHPTVNIKTHYNKDFSKYATDAMQASYDAAEGLIPLVPLNQAVAQYAELALHRALNQPTSEWDTAENAKLLASLILGDKVE